MSEQMVAVFGAGNMAHAIVRGASRSGCAFRFALCDVDEAQFRKFAEPQLSSSIVHTSTNVEETLDRAGADARALLAVKPQALGDVARGLAPLLTGAGRGVISILAGTSTANLQRALGEGARVVRAMPNLPAGVGAGVTALAPGESATPRDVEIAKSLFSGCGEVLQIDERLMDAFTAIAGSGPAYCFFLTDAMYQAAERLGFERDAARRIAEQTLLGAAALLQDSEQSAAELRDAVTSKGGTTAAALAVLEQRAVLGAFVDAMTAARDRGAELAQDG